MILRHRMLYLRMELRVFPIIFEKWLKFCHVCANITIDRRKAWVMPESKYSIGGIKNGISILFLL